MTSDPPSSTFDQKLSAVMGLVLSLLFIAGGIWVWRIDRHQQQTLKETQGQVVDSVSRRERDSDNREKITYAPVIEFEANGQPTRFTGKYQSYRPSTGNSVVVRYDSDQPDHQPRVVDPLEGLTPWAMVVLGGLGVIYSLGDLLALGQWLPGRRP